MEIKLIDRHSVDWVKAVTLVKSKYLEYFGATIDPNPDYFAVYYDAEASIKACGGISLAQSQPFFSEKYLRHSVAESIAAKLNSPVLREDIVEVGALASISHNAGSELIRLIPLLAWCKGKKYIFCTATRSLSRQFDRLGINFTELEAATPEALDANERERWGSYYSAAPSTGFINLSEMSESFMSNTGRYAFKNLEVKLYRNDRRVA